VSKAVTNATNLSMPIIKGGNVVLSLGVQADVVVVDVNAGAHGRLRDANGTEWLLADVSGRSLCSRPEGCVCPDGSAGAGVQFGAIAPDTALLGLTGGAGGAKVFVRGRSLDEFCQKPAKVDPCLVGTWIGEGVEITLPSVEIVGFGGKGAVLKFEKNGTGSVDLDPSTAVTATLPGELVGTFKISGQAAGIVNATQGVMTTIATSSSNIRFDIDVPPLGAYEVPGLNGVSPAPFDGLYTCTKTTLVYTAPGFGGKSTWARQQ
jgi:hypothetical protein